MRTKYIIYDLKKNTRKIIQSNYLLKDGHPSYLAEKTTIISDTYPLKWSRQHLFQISEIGNNYAELLNIYSDPRLYDEKRCDLHPRVTPDNRIVTVDSTFSEKKRSVILIRLKSYN